MFCLRPCQYLTVVPNTPRSSYTFTLVCNTSATHSATLLVGYSTDGPFLTLAALKPAETRALKIGSIHQTMLVRVAGADQKDGLTVVLEKNDIVSFILSDLEEKSVSSTVGKKRVSFSPEISSTSLGDGVHFKTIKKGVEGTQGVPRSILPHVRAQKFKFLVNGEHKVCRLSQLPEIFQHCLSGMALNEKRQLIIPSEFDSLDGKGVYEFELLGRVAN